MRHLNEIVRERNQYSRDAMEAWQDFINLKSRMDGELSKVTKRNNFLVDELESWKQQFLKFQAFAEQLTKETQDLKVKIENHKREHRRLSSLIEQQRDDAARLTMRLSGTEKQRDDALEALVLQQEIAEELERERKRNKKELAALQHTNATIVRQRDESQRVVLHLRSLIDGQTHHMEHIVRSLNTAPELNAYIGEGFEDAPEEPEEVVHETTQNDRLSPIEEVNRSDSRASSKLSDTNHVTPEMESQFFSSSPSNKPGSRLSISDVADRHLRDKTDAIADIIRNISEQCAAAVEGLQLAHEAEDHEVEDHEGHIDPTLKSKIGSAAEDSSRKTSLDPSDVDHRMETDSGHGGSIGHLTPSPDDEAARRSDSRSSSILPPTPDLVGGGNRSSTSMSGYSNSTSTATATTSKRDSQALSSSSKTDGTRIVGVDTHSEGDNNSDNGGGDARDIVEDVVGGKKSAVDVMAGSGRVLRA